MGRLYINPTIEKSIRQWCEVNDIEDVNAFANRCASQGLAILKYGTSPKDNINREINGIKDIKKNEKLKKQDFGSNKEREQVKEQENESRNGIEEESIKPKEETKPSVSVRKIRIIKKDKTDD